MRRTRQLVTVALIPMGAHIFRAFWSVLSIFLIDSDLITISEFGLILAAESIPSLFVPILVGSKITSIRDANKMIRRLLMLCCLSLVLIWLSIEVRSKVLFVVSIILFGAFSCSLTPLQRVLLKYQFHDGPATAAGVFTSAGNISKIVAKLLVSPAVQFFGGYDKALVVPIAANCIVTIIVVMLFDESSHEDEKCIFHASLNTQTIFVDQLSSEDEAVPLQEPEVSAFWSSESMNQFSLIMESLRLLPIYSMMLIYIHTIYILIFHIIMNFIPYMAVYVWYLSVQQASILSALPSFLAIPLCPLVGIIVTGSKYKKLHCLLAGVLAIIAYLFILREENLVILVLLLLSVAQSILFTVLLALIAIHTPVELVGCAFGLIEVLNAVGSILGNVIFGSLCGIGARCFYSLFFTFSASVIGCIALCVLAWNDIIELVYIPANQQYQNIENI